MKTTRVRMFFFLFLQFFGLFFCCGQDTSKNQMQKQMTREQWLELTHKGDLIEPDIQFPDTLFEKGSQAIVRLYVFGRNLGIIDTCMLVQIHVWPKGTKGKRKFQDLYSDVYGKDLKRSTPLGDSLAKKLAPWIENYRKHLKFVPNPSYNHTQGEWFSSVIEFEVGVKSRKGKK